MAESAYKTTPPMESEPSGRQVSNASVRATSDFEIPEVNRSRMPPGPAKYLDESLPPMDSLEAIFQDLVNKALSLGFADVLRRLGDRPLRVATVCSGTESPLLALKMIMQGMYKGSSEFHWLVLRSLLTHRINRSSHNAVAIPDRARVFV